MRYFELIPEKLSRPVRWRWTHDTSFEKAAEFRIGKILYSVSIFRYDSTQDAWELSFVAQDTYQATGTGRALTVFGTVADIALAFARDEQPRLVKIVSDTTERSRFVVNQRLARIVGEKIGYEASVDVDGDIILRPKGRVVESEDRFTGSTFADDDGHEFSVEKLYAFAKGHPQLLVHDFPISKIEHDLEWWESGTVDGSQSHDHMQTVDTAYPILVVRHPDGHLSVCDGLNRLKKARDVEHKLAIPAYVLPWDEQTQAIARVDEGTRPTASARSLPWQARRTVS